MDVGGKKMKKGLLTAGVITLFLSIFYIGNNSMSGADEVIAETSTVSEATESTEVVDVQPTTETPVENLGCLSRIETDSEGNTYFYVNYEHRDLVEVPEELSDCVVYE